MVINLRPQAAHNGRLTALSLAVSLACTPAVLYAQDDAEADAAAEEATETVIVTGTRTTGLDEYTSTSPVQVLSAEELESAGRPDLMNSLANVVPSFTAQAFGGDMANQTLQAKMRGLSPNHTLVLVNGKRRHTTSSLAILGGPYQGGAGVDLNFIPVDSIQHVEVLTEGAAAQYGTDAIAGVINIIMKRNPSGASVSYSHGGHYAGDGDTTTYTRQPRPGGDWPARTSASPPSTASMRTPTAATSIRAWSTRRASIRMRAALSRTPTCRSRRVIRTSTRSSATPPTR